MDPVMKRSAILLAAILAVAGVIAGLLLLLSSGGSDEPNEKLTEADQEAISKIVKGFTTTATTYGVKVSDQPPSSFILFHQQALDYNPEVGPSRQEVNKILEKDFAQLSSFNLGADSIYSLSDLDEMDRSQALVGYEGLEPAFEVPGKFRNQQGEPRVTVSVTTRVQKKELSYLGGDQDGNEAPKDKNWAYSEGSNPLIFDAILAKKSGKWTVINVEQVSAEGLLSMDRRPNTIALDEKKTFKLSYPKLGQYGDIRECLKTLTNC